MGVENDSRSGKEIAVPHWKGPWPPKHISTLNKGEIFLLCDISFAKICFPTETVRTENMVSTLSFQMSSQQHPDVTSNRRGLNTHRPGSRKK